MTADSYRATRAAPWWVLASQAAAGTSPALMPPARAFRVSASPAATMRPSTRMFLAAFRSSHLRGPRAVLRSKSPDLVTQEIWGHLCCHYAVRSLMFDAANHAGHDPDRVSFVAAVRISRRSIAQQGAFPPDADDTIWRL